MQNVINILIRKLYHRIPTPVLEEAFRPTYHNRTLDALIKERIIVDTVLTDCNLYAGKTKKIPLSIDYIKRVEDAGSSRYISSDYSVYYIPPEARENRDITVVLDLAYPSELTMTNMYPGQFLSGRSVANVADQALGNATQTPQYLTPTPILMGNNIVRLEPPSSLYTDYVLSCMLAFDKDFTNISTNMVNPIFKCVLYATQMFIYNELLIRMNQGFRQGGAPLASIVDIVNTYEGAEERYDESMKTLRGASMFDKSTMIQMINLMI